MRRLAFVAVLVLSCRPRGEASSSDGYWARACVTKDEKLLLASGDEAAAIELATGKTVARTKFYGSLLVCDVSDGAAYDNGESEAVKLPQGTRGPVSNVVVRDIALVRVDGTYLRAKRPTDSKGRATGPMTLQPDAKKTFVLEPSLFGAVGAAMTSSSTRGFRTSIEGETADGRVLLVAGWEPNRLGSVDPIPWGLFAFDATTGKATLVGVTRPNDEARGIWNIDDTAAARDASAFAATFRKDDASHLAIYDPAKAAPRFVVPLPDARESTVLGFSAAGDRVVVATQVPSGSQSHVRVVDVATGAIAWSTPAMPGTVYHAQFLADGSVVHAASTRLVTLVDRNGATKWQSRP